MNQLYITVCVLGLDTDKNEIYAEQNAGSSCADAFQEATTNPIWITVTDGNCCDDGTRGNHENWLEQVNKLRSECHVPNLQIMLEGSALYYLLNRKQITITHETDLQEDTESACAECGLEMEICEECESEFCTDCDSHSCGSDD